MTEDNDFQKSWRAAKSLAEDFGQDLPLYLSNDFQEAGVRKYFLDKFFKSALGWE